MCEAVFLDSSTVSVKLMNAFKNNNSTPKSLNRQGSKEKKKKE